MNAIECPDRLLGAIYDSVMDQEPWVAGLEQLRVALDANSTSLRMSKRGPRQNEVIYAAGPIVKPENVRLWEDKLLHDTLPTAPPLGETWINEWHNMPSSYAVEMNKGWDIYITAGHCFAAVENTSMALYVSRGKANTCFSERDLALIESAGRHFGRALRLRQEMKHKEVVADFYAEAMERMSVGGVLIGACGSVTTLNATAERIIRDRDGLYMTAGRLHATDSLMDRQLQTTLRSVLSGEFSKRCVALALPRESDRRDLGLVMSPRPTTSLITGRDELNALLFLRDSETTLNFDAHLLQQLFSFTPAEASLAIGLAQGKSFEDIESALNIRHNTARAHLRSIFVKADVNRQAKLVSLIASSLGSFGGSNVVPDRPGANH